MWRKMKVAPSPSGNPGVTRFQSFRRWQQSYYSANLTNKQKILFMRNTLFFSAEFRRRFLRSFINSQSITPYNNSQEQTNLSSLYCFAPLGQKGQSSVMVLAPSINGGEEKNKTKMNCSSLSNWRKMSAEKSLNGFISTNLYSSSFWLLNNPTIVPGTVRIRRLKQAFHRQQTANRMLDAWLATKAGGGAAAPQSLLSAVYNELRYSKNTSAWGLLQAFESTLNRTVFKAGWAASLNESSNALKHRKVCQNHQWTKPGSINTPPLPGDLLVAKDFLCSRHYKSFYSMIFLST